MEYRSCLGVEKFLRLGDGSLFPLDLLPRSSVVTVGTERLCIEDLERRAFRMIVGVEDSGDRDSGQGIGVFAQGVQGDRGA